MLHLAAIYLICCYVTMHVESFSLQEQKLPRKNIPVVMVTSTPHGIASPLEQQEQREDHLTRIEEPQTMKERLLDLLPRMKTEEDGRSAENFINTMESDFTPFQTLDFMNLAVGGEWQLLFSTKLRGGPRPTFRITEMIQKVEPSGLNGTIVNKVKWELVQNEETNSFDCFGTFSVVCSYAIHQGARMSMELKDHKIELLRGSTVPEDVPALVGLLHRNMPTELFDPSEHAMDTTYIDSDLKITRFTGPNLEGVRNVFIRTGI